MDERDENYPTFIFYEKFNVMFLFQHFVRNLFHVNKRTMRKVLKKRKVLNKIIENNLLILNKYNKYFWKNFGRIVEFPILISKMFFRGPYVGQDLGGGNVNH